MATGEIFIRIAAAGFERLTGRLHRAALRAQRRAEEFISIVRVTGELVVEWTQPGEHHQHRDLSPNQAERRAWDLLNEWLTPAQRRSLEDHNCFSVVGSRSGREYQIHKGGAFNVHWRASRGVTAALCFGPGGLPIGDVMLAQKIVLESNEDAALDVANWVFGDPSPHVRCCEGRYFGDWRALAKFATEIKSPLSDNLRFGGTNIIYRGRRVIRDSSARSGCRIVDSFVDPYEHAPIVIPAPGS